MNKIEKALTVRGLRNLFSAIQKNPAAKGEYVLWPYGAPVSTAAQAVEFAFAVLRGIGKVKAPS